MDSKKSPFLYVSLPFSIKLDILCILQNDLFVKYYNLNNFISNRSNRINFISNKASKSPISLVKRGELLTYASFIDLGKAYNKSLG